MRLFRYEEMGDYYVCPSGQRMDPIRRSAGNPAEQQRGYVQYATAACPSCASRAQCTRGAQRTVQRTQGQEIKQALRQVMLQPGAKREFAKRKAMVEPVFASLRERQGFNRLRRRGLARVSLELRLHLMAYNLGRALAYIRRGLGASGSWWAPLWEPVQTLIGILAAFCGCSSPILSGPQQQRLA